MVDTNENAWHALKLRLQKGDGVKENIINIKLKEKKFSQTHESQTCI